jgi:hypothetical protein
MGVVYRAEHLLLRRLAPLVARIDALELPAWTADDARRAWQAGGDR